MGTPATENGLNVKFGMKVKSKKNGRVGLVIPDIFGVCGKGEVLVEFDFSKNALAVLLQDLELIDEVKPEVNFEKCFDCVFFNGQECLRCTLRRAVFLLGNGKKYPSRIYPHCQNQFKT